MSDTSVSKPVPSVYSNDLMDFFALICILESIDEKNYYFRQLSEI